MSFLQASDLGKLRQDKWVVKDITINLQQFQKLAISGETGSGKSSLLQMLAGIINPDKGEVFFEGIRLKKVPEEKLLPGHPGIAYLSQQFELPHNMRVEEILEYSNELSTERAKQLYAICQVDHLLKRKHDQVSGGERQRIALARLLGSLPRLLLLDEPYSNLDPIHKSTLKTVIQDISDELGMTCVLVSHDPLDTIGWAEQIMVLKHGRVVQKDVPENIYFKPVDEYVAGLFGRYNIASADFADENQVGKIIRPSQILVSRNSSNGVSARIQELVFSGNYYELKFELNGSSFFAIDHRFDWQVGEEIFVRISQ